MSVGKYALDPPDEMLFNSLESTRDRHGTDVALRALLRGSATSSRFPLAGMLVFRFHQEYDNLMI